MYSVEPTSPNLQSQHPHLRQSSCQNMSRAFSKKRSTIRLPHPAHSFATIGAGSHGCWIVHEWCVTTSDDCCWTVVNPMTLMLLSSSCFARLFLSEILCFLRFFFPSSIASLHMSLSFTSFIIINWLFIDISIKLHFSHSSRLPSHIGSVVMTRSSPIANASHTITLEQQTVHVFFIN